MAELARRDGDYEGALEQLDIALRDPRIDSIASRELREYRTLLETESARLVELTGFEEWGEATPEDYRALAHIFAQRQRWDEAIEFQMNAPATPDDKDTLAYLLFEAGRFRDAHAIYSDLAASLGRASDQVNRAIEKFIPVHTPATTMLRPSRRTSRSSTSAVAGPTASG